MNLAAIYLFVTLTLFPGAVIQGQPSNDPESFRAWLTFTREVCEEYDVPFHAFLGLCTTESGVPGEVKLRFGRLGKTIYFGPGGINERCRILRGLNLSNAYIATWVAVRAVAYWKNKKGSLKGALRKYNAEFNEDYYRAVKGAGAWWREHIEDPGLFALVFRVKE